MKRFRVFFMMMTALLVSTATVNAQAPQYFPPTPAYPLPAELATLEAAPKTDDDYEPETPAWYVQAAEQTVAAWQRLRSLCQTMSCGDTQAKPHVCEKAAGCAAGTAGCANGVQIEVVRGRQTVPGMEGCPAELCDLFQKIQEATQCAGAQAPCCGIKGFLQLPCPFAAEKVAAACACAKACGCCDGCKVKAAKTAQAPQMPITPPQTQWALPAPGWVIPGTPAMPAPRVIIGLSTSVQQTKPAHLVTPDLEAHCQRIIHKDGTIILEGNVLLLCKKNAQPMRIEAPRIIVNMKDGSFIVESSAPTVTAHTIGVLRTSSMSPPSFVVPVLPVSEPLPMPRRVITVVPVPQQAAPR